MKSFIRPLALVATPILIIPSCMPNPRVSITDKTDLPAFNTPRLSIDQSPALPLQSIARRVANNHPQLKAAKLTLLEAKGHILQAGRYENPRVSIGSNLSLLSPEGSISGGFSQVFPITNKLALEKRVSNDAYQIAAVEIKHVAQQLTKVAQELAVECLGLEQQRKHIDKQHAALEKVAKFIEDAADRGELSSLDAAQTRLEMASLKAEQEALQLEQAITLTKLKGLIGLSPTSPLNLQGTLSAPKMPAHSLNIESLPQYQLKNWQIAQSKSKLLLEKAKRYEDLEMSVTGELGSEDDSLEGREAEASVGVELSIPLPLYNKNEGNIQATEAATKRIQIEQIAIKKEIQNRAHAEKMLMQSWLAQNTTLRKSLLPAAQKNSADLEKAYRQGQGNFTDFLKAKSQVLDLQAKLIDNNVAFHKARVAYLSTIGKSQHVF